MHPQKLLEIHPCKKNYEINSMLTIYPYDKT